MRLAIVVAWGNGRWLTVQGLDKLKTAKQLGTGVRTVMLAVFEELVVPITCERRAKNIRLWSMSLRE